MNLRTRLRRWWIGADLYDFAVLSVASAESASQVLDASKAEAWNEGWNAAVDSDGFPGDVNPYRDEQEPTP